jgi:ABC-type branched-subunit amino acid transport system substrate-binding protein
MENKMSIIRRSHRRRLITAAATLTAAALALSACGSDSAGGVNAEDAKAQANELAEILSIPEGADLGSDLTWQLGATLTLSGPTAANSEAMQNAIELAVEQIKAAGGPTIELSVKDIGAPDPVAAKQAIDELGAEKVPAKITVMGDGLGAMLADTDKYRILSLDGQGGAQVFTRGFEYFYGTREVAPADAVPGAMKWVKEALPDAKTVGLAGVDLGPLNEPIRADMQAKIEAEGLEFNGLWETVSPAETDFTNLVANVKKNEPDVLYVAFGGAAPGAFAAAAKAAGIKSELMAIEFTPEAVAASKGVLDKEGLKFSMDYFDAENPPNPFAEVFVKAYEKAYGDKPDFYAANAYEEVFAFWQLIREVVAEGGDPNDSAQLKAALEANPVFPSVYGGDAATVGTLEIDLETHGVAHRPMGVYEYKAGQVSTLATYDINGADFQLAD